MSARCLAGVVLTLAAAAPGFAQTPYEGEGDPPTAVWTFDLEGPFGAAIYAEPGSGALLAEVFCEPGGEAEITLHDFAPDAGSPGEDGEPAQLILASPVGEARFLLDMATAAPGATSFTAIIQEQDALWAVFDTDDRVSVAAGGHEGTLTIGEAQADFQRLGAFCAG